MQNSNVRLRKFTLTAMLGAVGFLLMFLDISIPIMPGFIKFDFSELPMLVASFSMGPVAGAAACVVKNLLHLLTTESGGVGTLSNLILGIAFVVPAGMIYRHMKTRGGAVLGAVVGALISAIVSVPVNYFIIYPLYTKMMPMDVIVGMYTAIWSRVDTLLKSLIYFNMPFTFVKEMICACITFLIYKKISPLLHGKK